MSRASSANTQAIAPPEGIHLKMPSTVFDDAPAIGAEDLRLLYWDPTSWWAQSGHNPHRKATRRSARHVHRAQEDALRLLVTRGESAYAAAFAIEPDDGRSDWARTRDEIRAVLREKHIEIPKGDFSNGTLYRLVRKHGLQHRVFDVARLDYEAAERAGRRHLSDADDRRLRQTARLIRAHRDLGRALSDGLCDTAVFWRPQEHPGTLLRCRFDYLRPQRIFDIVKIAAGGARDIDGAIRRTIEDADLLISRRLQEEAWEQLVHFVAERRVYAWDETGERAQVLQSERATLESYVSGSAPQFVWIFTQLPVDEIGAERGAIVAPRWHKPTGAAWDAAGAQIAEGLKAYGEFSKNQSLDRPWSKVDDTKELTDADIRVRLKKELL